MIGFEPTFSTPITDNGFVDRTGYIGIINQAYLSIAVSPNHTYFLHLLYDFALNH